MGIHGVHGGHWMGVHGGHWMGVHGGHWMGGVHGGHWMGGVHGGQNGCTWWHWMGVHGGIGCVYMGAFHVCASLTHVGHSMGVSDGGHWMGVHWWHWMGVHGGHWMGVHGGHWMSVHSALDGSWVYMWPTSWTMVPVKPQQALFPIPQALTPLRPHCLNTIYNNG